MNRILMPLPHRDFDPTEAAVSWKVLSELGHSISFATPEGEEASADPRMLTGSGLGPFQQLKADPMALQAYLEMVVSKEFRHPLRWSECRVDAFDGLVLPGGHAPGMKEYLESEILQEMVARFFELKKPVGAICHGVVLAARARASNGHSVLHGRRTTTLPSWMELSAWAMTCLWLKNYYRTYPTTVQQEVRTQLADPRHLIRGPFSLKRDSVGRLQDGFVVTDVNYVSARWPGDAHRFAVEFSKLFRDSQESEP